MLICLHLFQYRYFILYIKPTKIHKRKFDSDGVEIEPNFSETKKVNTGYLMSSFSEYRELGCNWATISLNGIHLGGQIPFLYFEYQTQWFFGRGPHLPINVSDFHVLLALLYFHISLQIWV